ncbi:MAG TPA: branched-chain amino acid ABC transporter permease [Symbiobacteriaceae bacterium]|nr:branched-chain amino acid ABC transporter permease [Symbiobacteriaceae bacterium]
MLQAIISGLVMGSIYALIAQGYYITSITTGRINFGQGDFLMMGSMAGLFFLTGKLPGLLVDVGIKLPWFVSLLLALAVIGCLGYLLERIAVRPLRRMMAVGAIMGTIAVAIMLRNVAILLYGRDVLPVPSPFGTKYLHFLGAGVSAHEIFVIIISLLAMGGLWLFLQRSILGRALRAVAHNREAAALMGIDVDRMTSLAFVLASVLAGLGGMLVTPITFASAYLGSILGLKAFAAAIIGGLEDPAGILVGGILLGVAEQLFGRWNSAAQDAAAFVFILLILVVRPAGLFGRAVREKV